MEGTGVLTLGNLVCQSINACVLYYIKRENVIKLAAVWCKGYIEPTKRPSCNQSMKWAESAGQGKQPPIHARKVMFFGGYTCTFNYCMPSSLHVFLL